MANNKHISRTLRSIDAKLHVVCDAVAERITKALDSKAFDLHAKTLTDAK